ncbi:hypothetical protein LMS44_07570 [Halomonas profundus]|nr:hypothetical protein LMS44_07570 [Halomonas profundus]
MKQLKHAKKQLQSVSSLSKQISWLTEKSEIVSKQPSSSLNIALISGEELYFSLQYEANTIVLTETNWMWVLKHGGVDLILIESCSVASTGDWVMAQTVSDLKYSPLGMLIKAARQYHVPVAYWFTLDEIYLPQYEPAIKWIGHAFCADDRVAVALRKQAISSTYLPPAVQPALFNKPILSKLETHMLKRVICDNLFEVISSKGLRDSFYQDLQEFGAHFYDSRNRIEHKDVKELQLSSERLLGSLDFQARVALFQQSRTLVILKSEKITRTELQWSIVEAIASHMTVLLDIKVDVGKYDSFCLKPGNQNQFFAELIRYDKDYLYYQSVSQKMRDEVLIKHTFFHRLMTIFQQLGLPFQDLNCHSDKAVRCL